MYLWHLTTLFLSIYNMEKYQLKQVNKNKDLKLYNRIYNHSLKAFLCGLQLTNNQVEVKTNA